MTGAVGYAQRDSYEEQIQRVLATAPMKARDFQEHWILKSEDYTGDGQKELIAFICTDAFSEEGYSSETYELYYCSNGKISICDTLCGTFYQLPEIIKINNVSLLTYTIGHGGPDGETFCWKSTKDKLVPVIMPGELKIIGDNYFSCSVSDFGGMQADGENNTIGRCWYTYYYYFDGNEFKEYKGKRISENEFASIIGSADLISEIKSNGITVRNIIYRSNGIIDINCSIRREKEDLGWMSRPGGTAFLYLELVYQNGGWQINGDWNDGNIKPSNPLTKE